MRDINCRLTLILLLTATIWVCIMDTAYAARGEVRHIFIMENSTNMAVAGGDIHRAIPDMLNTRLTYKKDRTVRLTDSVAVISASAQPLDVVRLKTKSDYLNDLQEVRKGLDKFTYKHKKADLVKALEMAEKMIADAEPGASKTIIYIIMTGRGLSQTSQNQAQFTKVLRSLITKAEIVPILLRASARSGSVKTLARLLRVSSSAMLIKNPRLISARIDGRTGDTGGRLTEKILVSFPNVYKNEFHQLMKRQVKQEINYWQVKVMHQAVPNRLASELADLNVPSLEARLKELNARMVVSVNQDKINQISYRVFTSDGNTDSFQLEPVPGSTGLGRRLARQFFEDYNEVELELLKELIPENLVQISFVLTIPPSVVPIKPEAIQMSTKSISPQFSEKGLTFNEEFAANFLVPYGKPLTINLHPASIGDEAGENLLLLGKYTLDDKYWHSFSETEGGVIKKDVTKICSKDCKPVRLRVAAQALIPPRIGKFTGFKTVSFNSPPTKVKIRFTDPNAGDEGFKDLGEKKVLGCLPYDLQVRLSPVFVERAQTDNGQKPIKLPRFHLAFGERVSYFPTGQDGEVKVSLFFNFPFIALYALQSENNPRSINDCLTLTKSLLESRRPLHFTSCEDMATVIRQLAAKIIRKPDLLQDHELRRTWRGILIDYANVKGNCLMTNNKLGMTNLVTLPEIFESLVLLSDGDQSGTWETEKSEDGGGLKRQFRGAYADYSRDAKTVLGSTLCESANMRNGCQRLRKYSDRAFKSFK